MQQAAEEATPESITGTGGIHAVCLTAIDPQDLVVPDALSAIATQSFYQNRDTIGLSCLFGSLTQHIFLFLRNLQEIHLGQNGLNCLNAGIPIIIPHQIAVVYVKADHLAIALAFSQRIDGGVSGRIPGQRAGTGMDHIGIFYTGSIHIFPAQEHICTGLTGKGEATVTGFVQRNECHGGDGFIHQLGAANSNIIGFQGIYQETTKVIIAYTATKTSLQAVPGCCHCHIGRCATGFADVGTFLLSGKEVNDHFAYTNQIHISTLHLGKAEPIQGMVRLSGEKLLRTWTAASSHAGKPSVPPEQG